MKRTFLTIALALSISAALAQAPKAKVDSAQVKGFSAQEKESVIGVISTARNTIFQSNTPNTPQQDLALLQQIDQVIRLLNERIVARDPQAAPAEEPKSKP